MSFSLEELCALVNVEYERAVEAEARVSSEDEGLWKTRIKSVGAKDVNSEQH